MPRPVFAVVLFALLFIASALPAWAEADKGSEAAARLHRMLSAWMLDLGDVVGHDGLGYVVDVTEDGDGTITAAIRQLSFDMAGGLGSWPDLRWNVGDIVAKLVPIDRERYGLSWTLPARTAVFDRKGNPIGGTVIGSQNVSGVYAPHVGFSTQFDGAWSGVTAWLDLPRRESLRLQVANIGLDRIYRELDGGKWDGQDSLVLQDVSVTLAGQEALRLDGLAFDASFGALDLAFFNETNELFEHERLQRTAGHDDEDALVASMAEALALTRKHAPLAESLGFAIAVNGLSAQNPDDVSSSLSLAEARFALVMQGLDGNRGSLAIEYEANALEAAPVPEPQAHVVPHDLTLHLVFDNLPIMDAATMALNMAESATLEPEAFEDAPEAIFHFMALSLQRRMAQQEGSFQLRQFAYDSPMLDATMTGELVASDTSPAMAVGALRLEVTGLERLMRRLQAAATDGDEESLEMAQSLALIQALGVRSEGGARHLYDLTLTQDGRILLNGNDAAMLAPALGVEP